MRLDIISLIEDSKIEQVFDVLNRAGFIIRLYTIPKEDGEINSLNSQYLIYIDSDIVRNDSTLISASSADLTNHKVIFELTIQTKGHGLDMNWRGMKGQQESIGYFELPRWIEERVSLYVNFKNNFVFGEKWEKFIEFRPENKHAGIQILSYFQETLNQKYPENNVTVRLGQKGNIVSMQIETTDGRTEVFERAFEEYSLVVTGKKPVEEYLDNKLNQAQLITKLELAGAELRSTERLLGIEREKNQLLQDNLLFAQKVLESTIGNSFIIANKLADAHLKAMDNQDVTKILQHLDSILNLNGEEATIKELNDLKSKDSTLWNELVKHAYKIAEKAVYKLSSEQLITLILSMVEHT